MHEATRRYLHELAATSRLPLSRLGRTVRREIQPLFDGGVIRIMRSGGGEAVCVENPDTLAAFIQANFPEQACAAELPARARAVRGMRNAKQSHGRHPAILLLRAFRPLTCILDGQAIDLHAITRQCGAVALLLQPDSRLELTGTLALIENQECFLHAERMGLAGEAALYTGGRLAGLILEKLADSGTARFLHCPDYDPVGLGEFIRYRQILGQRLRLHIPDDLRHLLQTYGKPTLLHGRNAVLMQVLRKANHPAIRQILTWMDEANAGLEQEVLIRTGKEVEADHAG